MQLLLHYFGDRRLSALRIAVGWSNLAPQAPFDELRMPAPL
jgi:hypothetical protein